MIIKNIVSVQDSLRVRRIFILANICGNAQHLDVFLLCDFYNFLRDHVSMVAGAYNRPRLGTIPYDHREYPPIKIAGVPPC